MTRASGVTAEWSLRLAKPEDADALPDIERAAGRLFEHDPDLSDFDMDMVREPDELRKLIARGHSLVAESGGAIIGFLVNQPFRRELHIWEISVHPRFQRGGIGAALMRACMIDARNTGFAAITLTTFSDIAWNAPFYERLAFETVEDLSAHPRLGRQLAAEARDGLPPDRRIAMIRFLG